MKVYTVLGSTNYEGFSEPLGVFTLYSLAKECGEKYKKDYDGIEIFECDLNGGVSSASVLEY